MTRALKARVFDDDRSSEMPHHALAFTPIQCLPNSPHPITHFKMQHPTLPRTLPLFCTQPARAILPVRPALLASYWRQWSISRPFSSTLCPLPTIPPGASSPLPSSLLPHTRAHTPPLPLSPLSHSSANHSVGRTLADACRSMWVGGVVPPGFTEPLLLP